MDRGRSIGSPSDLCRCGGAVRPWEPIVIRTRRSAAGCGWRAAADTMGVPAVRMPLLALLAKEPAHGYELRGRLVRVFGEVYPAPNIGQIYVTLQRLERDGLVRSQDVVQATRPNKRVYELTAAGRAALAAWIGKPGSEPRVRDDFFMKLALSPMAGAADRLELINRQRRIYLNQMRDLATLADTTNRGDPIPMLLVEGAMLHLQADLDWLERCQEELA